MRALIQRVRWARVVVSGETVGEIGPGLLTFLGVGKGDTEAICDSLVAKILRLRVFEDSAGKMNQSLVDSRGSHLLVSQFTLYADVSQGNRPGFSAAAPPELAERLYERALAQSRAAGVETQGGRFRAHMEVSLSNDGPVTLWVEQE